MLCSGKFCTISPFSLLPVSFLSVCLFSCFSVCLCVCLSVCLSAGLSVCFSFHRHYALYPSFTFPRHGKSDCCIAMLWNEQGLTHCGCLWYISYFEARTHTTRRGKPESNTQQNISAFFKNHTLQCSVHFTTQLLTLYIVRLSMIFFSYPRRLRNRVLFSFYASPRVHPSWWRRRGKGPGL